MGFDVFQECASRGGAAFFEALPKEGVVGVSATMVPEVVADILGLSVELGEQGIEGFRGEVRVFCQGLVEFCDVGGVVFVVMDFHRFRIDEGFERIVVVAKGGDFVRFRRVLSVGGV